MRPYGRADVEAAGGRGCVALIHSLLRSLEVRQYHVSCLPLHWLFLLPGHFRCFHNTVFVHKQTKHALHAHAHVHTHKISLTHGRSHRGGCWRMCQGNTEI